MRESLSEFTVRSEPGETETAETAETQTAETQTAETKTAETQTAETQTAETQTAETQTAEPEDVETAESEAARVRPYWIPQDVEFETLPDELKTAIVGIVNPAYRVLVLEAPEGLEQSTGMTIVNLLWLEILDQIELGTGFNNGNPDREARKEREALIARLLRTVGAKSKVSNVLIRIYEIRRKWGSLIPVPDPLCTSKPRQVRK